MSDADLGATRERPEVNPRLPVRREGDIENGKRQQTESVRAHEALGECPASPRFIFWEEG